MSHKEQGLLASYNSLLDEHLAGYFANKSKRKHLRRAGLITKDGVIVDESTYRLQMARKDQRKHVRNLIASEIVSKALNMERMRRYKIERELEHKYKEELVKELKNEGYHNKLKNGITLLPMEKKPRAQSSKEVRTKLPKLDRRAVSSSVSSKTSSERSTPKAPRHSRHKPSRPVAHKVQLQSMAEVSVKFLGTSVGQAHSRKAPSHSRGQEVMVIQQHCGGNTLCVFKEILLPNTLFTFISRRHRGLPFGLAFYIDGILDFRLSCCCEYRHKPGHTLGGKSGHFSYVSVSGAAPCYRCQVAASMNVSRSDDGAMPSNAAEARASDSDEEEALKSFDIIVTVSSPRPPPTDANQGSHRSIRSIDGSTEQKDISNAKSDETNSNKIVDGTYNDEDFDDGSSASSDHSSSGDHTHSSSSSSSSSESDSEHHSKDSDADIAIEEVVPHSGDVTSVTTEDSTHESHDTSSVTTEGSVHDAASVASVESEHTTKAMSTHSNELSVHDSANEVPVEVAEEEIGTSQDDHESIHSGDSQHTFDINSADDDKKSSDAEKRGTPTRALSRQDYKDDKSHSANSSSDSNSVSSQSSSSSAATFDINKQSEKEDVEVTELQSVPTTNGQHNLPQDNSN